MSERLPKVWVLLGARAGDNAQALELARQLGGSFEIKQLAFNRLSGLPNVVLGAGFKSLAGEHDFHPPWPDIVIATARRAAPVSLAIKAASGGRTLVVHIGRPRMQLSRFDLVLATPQYGLPDAENVVQLLFPFAQTKSETVETLQQFSQTWSHLPRPWHVGVIGAGKFPIQFGRDELDGFALALNGLAQRSGGSVILLDSPRSSVGALKRVDAGIAVPRWMWERGTGRNPYQAALALADSLAVTSDSVSMVSEMVQTGKPVHVFRLPTFRWMPRWSATAAVAGALARHGVVVPPRDVAAFLSVLSRRGWIGDLAAGQAPLHRFGPTDEHQAAVRRIISLWQAGARD